MLNTYTLMGVLLTLLGFLITPYSYYIIDSVPLSAVGLSALILGFTSIGLGNARPGVSLESARLFMKTGTISATMLLEVSGIKGKAVYYPRKMLGGNSQALVPINGDADVRKLKSILGQSVIDTYPIGAEGTAIALTTPGNLSLELLPARPGKTAGEIKSALKDVFKVLEIANVDSVKIKDYLINIEVSEPGIRYDEKDKLYYQYIGSPVASIAAAICCEALEKPVRIVEETLHKGKNRISLETVF